MFFESYLHIPILTFTDFEHYIIKEIPYYVLPPRGRLMRTNLIRRFLTFERFKDNINNALDNFLEDTKYANINISKEILIKRRNSDERIYVNGTGRKNRISLFEYPVSKTRRKNHYTYN